MIDLGPEKKSHVPFHPLRKAKIHKMRQINIAGLVQYTFPLANIGCSDRGVHHDSDKKLQLLLEIITGYGVTSLRIDLMQRSKQTT